MPRLRHQQRQGDTPASTRYSTVGHDVAVVLTRAQQQESADLIQHLLDLVDEGHIAADGPAGVALVRHLEGAMLALRAMDRSAIPTVESSAN